MIDIQTIREVPPDIDPAAAIKMLNYVTQELQKDPGRTLTARQLVTKMTLHYERKVRS